MLKSCAEQLFETVEDAAFMPTRAELALHVLNMANEGTPFLAFPGVLDELQSAIADLESANVWQGGDPLLSKLRSHLKAVKDRMAELKNHIVPGQINYPLPEALLLTSGRYDNLITATA
jgi:hypothetical protein